jgi:hypothetical protein
MKDVLENLFGVKKPVIGMIHLTGDYNEKVSNALKELLLYQEEDVDGAIVEDYHGAPSDIWEVMRQSNNSDFKIVRGINCLAKSYLGFSFAQELGAKFVQFDSVESSNLDVQRYLDLRERYSDIAVLGGVRFKYQPTTGKSLDEDLKDACRICEAIVTTGEGTGIETPFDKLQDFKLHLPNFPLFVGAGVTIDNVAQQLNVCDGAIVGSYFKYENKTENQIDRSKVRDFMQVVKKLRN